MKTFQLHPPCFLAGRFSFIQAFVPNFPRIKATKLGISTALGTYLAIALTSVAPAQPAPRALSRLPEPPPIRAANPSQAVPTICQPTAAVRPTAVAPKKKPARREYVFQAPQAEPRRSPHTLSPSRPAVRSAARQATARSSPSYRLYRVEVVGNSDTLLWQVRKVEPLAFVRLGEGTIQGGLFGQQQQAQRRVEELKKLGLRVRVVSVPYDVSAAR